MHRPRRGEARRPAPARQSHQHRLCDIVLLVSQPKRPARSVEKRHPCGPRLGFTRTRLRLHPRADHTLHFQRRANVSAKFLIREGMPSAQPVVEVQRA